MEKDKFATAINCIDGRAQSPVAEWLKKNVRADYVDAITEPGPEKALLQDADPIRKKALISISAHKSCVIAVAGHHDCAGNPVSKEEHVEQIKKCADIIKSWQLQVHVLGLWVNENWKIELVCDNEVS